MIEYLRGLEETAKTVEASRGPFTLFGLFMREDSLGTWDLVVSAPWLEEGKLKALGELVGILASKIGQEGVLAFSRIVTLDRDEPVLEAILSEVASRPLPVSREGHNLFGLPIEEADILRAHRRELPPSDKRMRRTKTAHAKAPRAANPPR
jgi:hypothetical protein